MAALQIARDGRIWVVSTPSQPIPKRSATRSGGTLAAGALP
jgi:hypothetical protein